MTVWRDWIEEHWAGVGTVVSIVGALAIAAFLALGFNVITTHLDGRHRDTSRRASPLSDARTLGGGTSAS